MSESQRDLVQRSANLPDTPEDRHGIYPKRRQPVTLDDDLLGMIRQVVREEIHTAFVRERDRRSGMGD